MSFPARNYPVLKYLETSSVSCLCKDDLSCEESQLFLPQPLLRLNCKHFGSDNEKYEKLTGKTKYRSYKEGAKTLLYFSR